MKLTLQKPDSIGALSSALCMLHCFATPFLFIAQTTSITQTSSVPVWWKWIDYLFLIISFFAVYRSSQTSSKKWIKNALWTSWISLFAVIINEKIEFIHLPETFTYIVAFSLILLHLYNRKYCQCKAVGCCNNKH